MTNYPAIRLRSGEFLALYGAYPELDIIKGDLFDPLLLERLGLRQGSAQHEQLLGWQRLLRVHPEESIAAVLFDDGLRSANAIARIPAARFAAAYGERFTQVAGSSATQLAQSVHQRATAIAAKTAHAFADLIGMLSPQLSAAPFANGAPELSAELRKLPSFEELFGSQDFLGCPNCGSIFGPAAYFTDLMRVIDRYITDPTSGNKIPDGMRLEDRRPDLFDSLHLDCAATNDKISYLALINEILLALIDPDDPQAAPRALATAVYPFTTPFNLPLIGIRQVLKQLGTSLPDVWSAFPAPAYAGRASEARGTTLVLDENASAESGAYALMRVLVADGPAAGQERRIVAYDGPARTATLDREFEPAPPGPPVVLVYDTIDKARETLGLTGEQLDLLLAPPVDKSDPVALSAAYGVTDIRDYVPRAGAGTLTVRSGAKTADLTGATFTDADLGNQLLIGEQLRTVVKLEPGGSRAVVAAAWDSDAAGGYEVFPFAGFDRAGQLAARAGLSADQLSALLRQGLSDAELAAGAADRFYVNSTGEPGAMSVVLDQRDPGNSVDRVTHLTIDRLDRLSRFTRLAGATGISYDDLDWAMRLAGGQTAITAHVIEALARLVTTAARTGLGVGTAAAYLGDLKTIGRGDGPAPCDLFDKVYNNPALLGGKDPYGPGSTTPFDPARPPRWAYRQHGLANETLRKRLGAALALGDDDLTALAAYCAGLIIDPAPDSLTLDLPLLSRFYRIALAASLARTSVSDLIRLIRAMGAPPPDDLSDLSRLLDCAAWVAGGPLTLDDIAAIVIPGPVTPDQLSDVRSFADRLAGLAAELGISTESFRSPAITAEESAELATELISRRVISRAGIIGEAVLDFKLATSLFPFLPDSFTGDVIDPAASAAIVAALISHDPPYLAHTPGQATKRRADGKAAPAQDIPAYLTTAYQPDTDLEFLFPDQDQLRAEQIAAVRALLSRTSASIGQVLTVLTGARDQQETLAVTGAARFIALDPVTFAAVLHLTTGAETLACYRQLLLTPIPASEPVPPTLVRLVATLWSARSWVTAFGMTAAEVAGLDRDPAAFDVTDPAAPSVADLRSLARYRALTTRFGDTWGDLLGYLTSTSPDLAGNLARITGWSEDQIRALIAAFWPLGDTAVTPLIRSVAGVSLLARCFSMASSASADVQSLLGLGRLARLRPDAQGWPVYEEAAAAALGMLAAYFGDQGFAEAFGSYSASTDTGLRDVALGYCIWMLASDDLAISGPADLYSRLLIDVEMSACDVTTRVAQAINSAQLYLQRCRIGQEPGVTNLRGIEPRWWEWLSSYRAWEANRKVFLYPENYLDPTLRRNVSPEFADLKQNLMQTRVTEMAVTSAYSEYFQGLTDLAALVPCAAFEDVAAAIGDTPRQSTLYLFARTKTAPYTYYYLTRRDGDSWTSWRKIDLTINSAFVTPVLAFDKLFIFWAEADVIKSSTVAMSGSTTSTETQTIFFATLRYAFKNLTGKWTSAQTLADKVPVRVLPQPYAVFNKYPELADLYDPANLFWLQPQAVKVARGLRGRAKARLYNVTGGDPVAGRGLVSVSVSSAEVTGNGTEFLSQLRPGYLLAVGGSERQIVAITGPASLVVDSPFPASAQDVAFSFGITVGKVAGAAGAWATRTSFTSQVAVGDHVSSAAQLGLVSEVVSDSELTMADPWAWPAEAGEYKIIPSDPLQTTFHPFAGPGTIALSDTLRSVHGTGTSFLSTVSIGDQVYSAGGTRTVIGLASDTTLIVDSPWQHAIPVAPYTIVPQDSGAEGLFVQLGPPLEVRQDYQFDIWKPLANLGDDPYLDALNKLNSRVSDALDYCRQVRPITPSGEVSAGIGFFIDQDLNHQFARAFIAADGEPEPGSPSPYAQALDRGNSALVAVSVASSVGGEYWLNSAPARRTPIQLGPSRASVLFNAAMSAGVRNVGNVPGAVMFDNGDEAFLLESQELSTWPIADRVTVVPYPLAPDSAAECRLDTGPYAPRPLGLAGALFGVTRLTTSTIAALARKLTAHGVPGLLTPESQRTPEIPFSRFYRTPNAGPPPTIDPEKLPPEQISFTGPFGLYQREIFFHTPYLVAALLSANARHEEAQIWYQYIFDPTTEPSDGDEGTRRFWRYLPFRDITVPALLQVLTDPAGIRAYNDDPFDPFAIAEVRTSAYAKAVVMRYVENLIGWGDALFARDTRESVSQAANVYLMAADLLGPRPRRLGDVPKPKPKTFGQIRDEYRAHKENIPQFLIDLEHTVLGTLAPDERQYVSTPVNDIDAYFCVPANTVLDSFWDLIDDRLGKIRNCQTLQGVTRVLAPFAPPLDIGSVLAGASPASGHPAEIGVELPAYRFTTLIDQARQLAALVVQFGGELLAALDRKDGEDLAQLQARQLGVILDLTTSIRRAQVDQLVAGHESLTQALAGAQYRQRAYADLASAGLIPSEVENLRASEDALMFNTLALAAQAASSIAYALPNIGSPFAMTYGGVQVGSALQAASAVLQIGSVVSGFVAERTLLMASYERRTGDWLFQAALAGNDASQFQAQLDASARAIDAAKQEYAVHVRSIEQNAEIESFLVSKFTSSELYGWLARQLSAVYYQLYTLAYTTARQAERAYQLEVGSTRRFITTSSWDDARRGLLAGEGLTLALGQLQQAYLQEYVRAYEIERTVSLLTTDPRALLQLRSTGECVFDLPERLFDQDFPGHYRRTISSLAVTIPALVGPYQSVRGTLTQLGSQIVMQPTRAAVAYLLGDTSVQPPGPDIIRSNVRVGQSIAVSTGVDDDGVFDASLSDGRYLPFERTGVVSQWRLRLPFASNQIDFSAMSDVVLTIRYTAFDGGDRFRADVQKLLPRYRGRQFVSLAQQYAAGWHDFLAEPVIEGGSQLMPFQLPASLLPPHMNPAEARVTAVYLALRTGIPFQASGQFVSVKLTTSGSPFLLTFRGGYAGTLEFAAGSGPLLRDLATSPQTLGFVLATAPAAFTTADRSRLRADAISDVQLVVDFEGPVSWPPAP